MIPKKASREILYNGHKWRYKVTVDKEFWYNVYVIYNTPDGKFHRKNLTMIDIYYWGGEGQTRDFTPKDFILRIIRDFHPEYYLQED